MKKLTIDKITPDMLKLFQTAYAQPSENLTIGFYFEDWTGKVRVLVDLGKNAGQKTICSQVIGINAAVEKINALAKTMPVYVYEDANTFKGFRTVVYGKKVAKEIKKNPRKTGKRMASAYRGML